MKIYKAYFRLDYPISFCLIDKLGEQLDLIHQLTSTPPYSKIENKLDVSAHSFTSNGQINNDLFRLFLSLTTFNGSIDFKDGLDIECFHNCKYFDLIDQVIENIKVKKYERVGIRILTILQKDEFRYDSIVQYLVRKNSSFTKSIGRIFDISDIGVIVESENPNAVCHRIGIGPYRAVEFNKNFSIDPQINEGLFLDIDIWERKINIPNIKLSEIARKDEKYYGSIIKNISDELAGELKNVTI